MWFKVAACSFDEDRTVKSACTRCHNTKAKIKDALEIVTQFSRSLEHFV